MPPKTQRLGYRPGTPFDSVKNTQEYFRLLSETLIEVSTEIERDIDAAQAANHRAGWKRCALFFLSCKNWKAT